MSIVRQIFFTDTNVAMTIVGAILIATIVFIVATLLLQNCRRKRGWLTIVVVVSYFAGIVFPAVIGLIVFGNGIHYFHYKTPDPDLWTLSCFAAVVMLGIIIGGGESIALALNNDDPNPNNEVS